MHVRPIGIYSVARQNFVKRKAIDRGDGEDLELTRNSLAAFNLTQSGRRNIEAPVVFACSDLRAFFLDIAHAKTHPEPYFFQEDAGWWVHGRSRHAFPNTVELYG